MKEAKPVKVVIDGEVYELTSDEKPEYVQTVALYIDGKIKEISKQRSSVSSTSKLRSLFISLNIADDLFKERKNTEIVMKENKELNETLSDYMDENAKLVHENTMLKEKVELLEKEMIDVKKELRQFLENF